MMRMKKLTGSKNTDVSYHRTEVIAQEKTSIISRTKSHRTTKKTGPISVVGYLRGRRTKERTMRISLTHERVNE